MPLITKRDFDPGFLQEVFVDLPPEGKLVFLKNYAAAADEVGRPTSDALTQSILDVAVNPDEAEETRVLAFAIAQTLVNPFSGKGIAPIVPVSKTLVTITDSYVVGERYKDGVFLGNFDLEDEKGNQPIFVVELTESMTFNQTVAATGKSENGYKADPRAYDAKQGLREGKTVIAPFDMVKAAYNNKDKGELAKMFKDVGWVLSSSPLPGSPYYVRIVDFRAGDGDWDYRGSTCAPSPLVRAGLTL